MPTSTHSHRISKPPSKRGSRRASRKTSQPATPPLQTTRQPEQPTTPTNEPLVERTNSLSLEEFTRLYVQNEDLGITNGSSSPDGPHPPPPSSSEQQQQQQQQHQYKIDIFTASTIPDPLFEQCFHLIETTSAEAYRASSIGWSPPKKRKEMKLPDMKYLVLRRATTSGSGAADVADDADTTFNVLGFLSFMVTYEDGFEVVYCYEVHLSAAVQRQGLGAQLMRVFLRIGERVGMQKAMLTVFRANGAAIRFYERLGFEVDESSPRPRRLRNGTVKDPDYRILSRVYRRE
ncbi:N-terminal L-serine N(alpha)-acetyltransferase NAT4 [Aspergillus saccharolyticus JOP 1030-1]|uniref:N-alpha-acetyltransferase 40 n=1 Tax=Aspergillus saccharolyticus JOP 1030-1 TaxID=1450539 RepID=A0A318ZIH3_9EURO|nr:hypothetical protein BP01DRAFT_414286 [Aspergillus saccharolyticus JOP 1030-1]PYH47381.1 hypothetical protein BP01DRAFT_414286 [Aspergillus saccharolyticus JOP 1030-1]